jgi:hypothetical protein
LLAYQRRFIAGAETTVQVISLFWRRAIKVAQIGTPLI